MERHAIRLAVVFALGLLAACETAPPRRVEPPAPGAAAEPAPPPVATPDAVPAPPAPLPGRPGARPTQPMPVRPLNILGDCSFLNETGYHGTATLEVRDSTVRRMRAVINIPKRGQCVFELAGMTQTKFLPSVELRSLTSACTARIWEQGNRVTLAFNNCASQCSPPDAFKHVWPVLFDRAGGRCD